MCLCLKMGKLGLKFASQCLFQPLILWLMCLSHQNRLEGILVWGRLAAERGWGTKEKVWGALGRGGRITYGDYFSDVRFGTETYALNEQCSVFPLLGRLGSLCSLHPEPRAVTWCLINILSEGVNAIVCKVPSIMCSLLYVKYLVLCAPFYAPFWSRFG